MGSRLARLLTLFLAVLPAIWGNCPGWFTDASCCPKMSAADSGGAKRASCPCCAARGAAGRVGCTAPTDDEHRRDSDGCPVLEVRHTATPAPANVGVPAAGLAVAILPSVPEAFGLLAFSQHAARLELGRSDPGGPPSLVGTIQLLI